MRSYTRRARYAFAASARSSRSTWRTYSASVDRQTCYIPEEGQCDAASTTSCQGSCLWWLPFTVHICKQDVLQSPLHMGQLSTSPCDHWLRQLRSCMLADEELCRPCFNIYLSTSPIHAQLSDCSHKRSCACGLHTRHSAPVQASYLEFMKGAVIMGSRSEPGCLGLWHMHMHAGLCQGMHDGRCRGNEEEEAHQRPNVCMPGHCHPRQRTVTACTRMSVCTAPTGNHSMTETY